jgi:hypothetical protein
VVDSLRLHGHRLVDIELVPVRHPRRIHQGGSRRPTTEHLHKTRRRGGSSPTLASGGVYIERELGRHWSQLSMWRSSWRWRAVSTGGSCIRVYCPYVWFW